MAQVYMAHRGKRQRSGWWGVILIMLFGIVLSFAYLLYVNNVAMGRRDVRAKEEIKLSINRDIGDIESKIASAMSVGKISAETKNLVAVRKTTVLTQRGASQIAMR